MTNNRQNEMLQNLFAAAMDAPPSALRLPTSALRPPSSDLPALHPADDDDLLLDWSLGQLSPDQHQQLLEHLADCSTCRREIATMVRVGALELPPVAAEHVAASFQDADSLAPNSLASDALAPDFPAHPASEMPDHVSEMPGHVSEMPDHVSEMPDHVSEMPDPVSGSPGHVSEMPVPVPSRHWRQRTIAVLVTALAASLLLMFARGVFDFGPRDGAALIARAQRDLQQGRADQAFARLDDYLSRTDALSADQQRDANALLEASGYELARSGLGQGDFKGVTDVDARVARRTGSSARLTNLRIQAERGETSERSLAARMSLFEHYDYELDGQQVIKSLTIRPITATDRRIEAELQAAIEAHPDAVDLRLNYGHLLLEQRYFERAEAEFAAAVALEPHNALAHTGLGVAILEQAEDKHDYQTAARALPHFQAAVRLSPDDPIIQQNLTICQNRLSLNAEP